MWFLRTDILLISVNKKFIQRYLLKDKCVFWVTQTVFLECKISKRETSEDPEKINEIKGMLFPRSKQELQRCLGMIAYLSKSSQVCLNKPIAWGN